MKPVPRLCLSTLLVLSIGLIAMQASAAPSGAQHAPGSLVRFVHLTQEDGLSQNAGLAFLQDSRGFMWIGTQDGLNRYDGHMAVANSKALHLAGITAETPDTIATVRMVSSSNHS